MSQSQPDRLDRIEQNLERASQQLDNQVVVNAELRQATAQLQQTTAQLTNAVEELRQSTTEIANAVSSIIGTVNQHQENFMVVVTEIRSLREDNQRILARIERLENRDNQ